MQATLPRWGRAVRLTRRTAKIPHASVRPRPPRVFSMILPCLQALSTPLFAASAAAVSSPIRQGSRVIVSQVQADDGGTPQSIKPMSTSPWPTSTTAHRPTRRLRILLLRQTNVVSPERERGVRFLTGFSQMRWPATAAGRHSPLARTTSSIQPAFSVSSA